MHRHVDHAGLDFDFLDLLNKSSDAPCNLYTPRGNSREYDFFELRITLDDFVRNAPQRTTNCLPVQDGDSSR